MRRDSNPSSRASGTRAVLFDFNGVLMDDEDLHFLAVRTVLAPLGIRITRRRYDERYLALDDHAACAAALADAGIPPRRRSRVVVGRLVAAKRRLHAGLCRSEGARVDPGAARLVRALARRLPLAVVSSAARREIVGPLRRAGLLTRFRFIISAEDVRRSKPHPEGYRQAVRRLRAAGLLGAGAACVAIEDSPGGIAAARAAGLPVLGVTTTFPATALWRAGAFAVVGSLSDSPRVLRLLQVRDASSRKASSQEAS